MALSDQRDDRLWLSACDKIASQKFRNGFEIGSLSGSHNNTGAFELLLLRRSIAFANMQLALRKATRGQTRTQCAASSTTTTAAAKSQCQPLVDNTLLRL